MSAQRLEQNGLKAGSTGLPLYEVVTLLGGEGYPVRFGWLNPV